MITLYALPQSPYCAKVRLVLRLKNIAFTEQEPAGGSYQSTDFQKQFSAGSVPAIEEDGWRLHDSQAIIEYLEERFPEPPLWHTNIRQRARQRAIVHYHDSMLEPKIRQLVPLVKQPVSIERSHAIDLLHDELFDRFYRLEKLSISGSWLGGDELSAVDISLTASIYKGIDLLDALGQQLELPQSLNVWLDWAMNHPLIGEEVTRMRGAIALWMKQDSERIN